MKKEIIINATANEVRLALTEDEQLAELYAETPERERMVGDIYLGKVARVMPGIRAAFIDIGFKQDAFLHFSDIGSSLSEYSSLIGEDDADVDTDDDDDDDDKESTSNSQHSPGPDGISNESPHPYENGGNSDRSESSHPVDSRSESEPREGGESSGESRNEGGDAPQRENNGGRRNFRNDRWRGRGRGRDNRNNRDNRDGGENRESTESRDNRDEREGGDNREGRDNRENREGRNNREGRDNRDNRGGRDNREGRNHRNGGKREGGERRSQGGGQVQAPNLVAGQDIIVQVTKEPVGRKGVRVTSEVSLPGRFLVLLPFDGKIGVSKKMNNFKEKRRLRRIVKSILPEGFGVIVRTVAQDKDEAILKQDLQSLIDTWREIEALVKTGKPPMLLHKDMSTTSSVIRDLFTEDVNRVVIDSKKLWKDIRTYVKSVSPHMLEKVELYAKREPIFDHYGIEKEIAACLSRKVWLKSGGYIIIEQTEAMVVVDVNSGRYAAKREQELNSLRTNLEAAREVTRQLRLRDIGGIIVIDFIDLEDDRNKKKVYDEIRKEFRKDRARVTVLPMTEFGLMQITRQRNRQNILLSFSEPCPTCGGSGLVQSKSAVVNQIERWIKRFRAESGEFRLDLHIHNSVADYLREGTISRLLKLMFKFRVKIKIVEESKMSAGEFKFHSPKQGKDITDKYRVQ